MAELQLDIHGVAVSIDGALEVLAELRRDFAWFEAPRRRPAALAWRLNLAAPPATRGGRPGLRWRDYAAYDDGDTRRVEYDDGARAVYDYAGRQGEIHCARPARLRELAYLAVLSRAGHALEARGWHRVHALGFESNGEGGLVVLPCGGGKSSLALELLRKTEFGLLGDDTVWIDPELRLRAFPLRWGFRDDADLRMIPPVFVRRMTRKLHGDKRVVDLPYFEDRVRDGVPLKRVYFGNRGPDAAGGSPVSRASSLAGLAAPLVVGVGVAQMTEYYFRLGSLGELARTTLGRVRLAGRVAAVPSFRLEMGASPAAAGSALALDVARQEQLHLGAALGRVGEPELAAGGPRDAIS